MQAFINIFFGVKQLPLYFLFSLIFAKKQEKRKLFLLSLFCFFLIGTPANYYLWEFVKGLYDTPYFAVANFIFYAFNFVIVIFFNWTCFSCSFFEAGLYALGAWTVESMSGSVAVTIGLKAGLDGVLYRDYSLEFFFVFLAVSLGAWIFTDVLFSVFCKERKIDLDKKRLLVPIITVFFIFVVLNMKTSMLFFSEPDKLLYSKYYSIACCVLLLFLLMEVFHTGSYRLQIETIEQLEKKQKDQYEMSKDTIEIINTKCHDLKKMLSSSLADGKLMTKEEMERLQEKISIYDSFIKTGNQTLDLVLSEKSLYCEKNGIRFTVMATAEKIDFISKLDIYSLFGNILDNAIEAVMKLDQKSRIISLSVKEVGGFIVVHEDNSFDGELTVEEGKIVTRKSDKTVHGYGLLSIRRVAEKYGGCMKTGRNDNVFHLNVMIPIKN